MTTAPTFNPTAPRLRPFPGARSWDVSNPWVFLGTLANKDRIRSRKGALVAPLDADPMSFSWPAAGLSIFLVGDEKKRDETERVAQALLRDGARLVAYVLAADGIVFYRYSSSNVEIQKQ
jgi:hypothetical protein